MNLRPKRFLEVLSKHKGQVGPAAREAGYTSSYAHSSPKIIRNTAMKEAVKELSERVNKKDLTKEETKQLMCDVMGLDSSIVLSTTRKIALQDKDYSSALKVLSPLLKELGIDISQQEQQNITVPVLNIGVTMQDKPNNNDIIEIKE